MTKDKLIHLIAYIILNIFCVVSLVRSAFVIVMQTDHWILGLICLVTSIVIFIHAGEDVKQLLLK